MRASAPQPPGRQVRATPAPPARDADADVAWHEAECGGYEADLALWEELADESVGSILDLGCGAGRVGLHLARRGHEVVGVDADPKLVAAFNERAAGLPARAVAGDARDFALEGEPGASDRFGLALAPMQLVQLLAGEGERVACLCCVAAHLAPGGRVALAIVEGAAMAASWDAPGAAASGSAAAGAEAPLPDVREAGGWVYSSLPLETALDGGAIVVRRLRQTVSPGGELSEAVDETRLRVLDAAALEGEARAAGLRPAGRREVLPTEAHLGSTVVLLEGEA